MDPTNALRSDFTLMAAVADLADARSGELRMSLTRFGNDMLAVPPAVWGGAAAHQFRAVMARWNRESGQLCAALSAIATTLRGNAAGLGEASRGHADRIAAVGAELPGR